MKVLFAVNNEDISEAIVKKYQRKYKEIISYKNVYYFNAILKEIQKDKTYDRIVVSEDLEQFTNTSYEQMDKFIFERLDSISDEAENIKGKDIPIILICTERRVKSEEMLVKLFGIGIYNAIIGNDRSVDEVCRLIFKPRLKKEAKAYYQIDSDSVSYKAENEDDVSEVEIQNILAHFKRLGKDEERYVNSYNNIAAQYNDNQLKIISKFLPLNVRAVLEEKSLKYQEVMAFNKAVSTNIKNKEAEKGKALSEKLLTNSKRTKPAQNIVVPSSMNSAENVKKLTRKPVKRVIEEPEEYEDEEPINEAPIMPIETFEEPIKSAELESAQPKRGRGRPRKNPITIESESTDIAPKKKRGRPRKNPEPEEEEEIKLPGLVDINSGLDDIDDEIQETESEELFENNNETILPGITADNSYDDNDEEDDEDVFVLPGNNMEEELQESDPIIPINPEPIQPVEPIQQIEPINHEPIRPIVEQQIRPERINNNVQDNFVDLSDVLYGNKKIAAFVGTSKNGTSFIVNNLAELLSSSGVNVAILDTTKNKNSYYIYTKNEEDLRRTAMLSINNLTTGMANGIRVNSNLAVYTSLPNEDSGIEEVQTVLSTLVKSHSIILVDCDFNSPKGYFSAAQEIYLVQTMDVLTIQPLTAFLKELVAQNILDEQKIRIIINKYTKIRGVSEKEIIGGMAYYNDPAMTYQTELFDKSTAKYITIPFEEETYTKYLEGLINCEVSLRGYSKMFLQSLRQLGNMLYPTETNKTNYRPPALNNTGNDTFTSSMNNTLDQMKRNY